MKKRIRAVILMGLFAGVFAVNSCVPRNTLRTVTVDPAAISGTYTVFLYGARHASDIETVAILADEAAPYKFGIYAPDFDYRVIKGMPAREAVQRAVKFVSFYHEFSYYRISGILDPSGAAIGYEVRPYYRPIEFGYSDVMDIWYAIADNRVTAHIHLKPEVEDLLRDGERRRPFLFRMR